MNLLKESTPHCSQAYHRKSGQTLLVGITVLIFAALTAAALTQGDDLKNSFAQKLADQIAQAHPELHVIGIHLTPPNGADNVIVASNIREKVGKKSDEDDLKVLRTGKPIVERPKDLSVAEYEVLLGLQDSSGKRIGTLALAYKPGTAKSKADALRRSEQIRDELKRQIPSEAKLFEAGE